MTMTTLTGRNARTLSGYVESLLDYPRWIIERDVDFSIWRSYLNRQSSLFLSS